MRRPLHGEHATGSTARTALVRMDHAIEADRQEARHRWYVTDILSLVTCYPIVYVTDGRLHIDNNLAELAIRPLAVGRKNWLHIGGDGGLTPTAVLLSLAATAKRHAWNPWGYFRHLLTELPARPPGSDLSDRLADTWSPSRAGPPPTDTP